jgi:hypothetical protein
VAVARLNRLARERPELVASLLDAGERVTRAQTGRDRGASTAGPPTSIAPRSRRSAASSTA